jgi:hypothetical protein
MTAAPIPIRRLGDLVVAAIGFGAMVLSSSGTLDRLLARTVPAGAPLL